MKRKLSTLLVCVVLLSTLLCGLFCGCKEEEKKTIVYLGDSIAEGIIGPSPLEERENYSYYGIIGQINDYTFINRSISGYTTKRFLGYLQRPEKGATMHQTWIKRADIIHVSILGNDVLRPDDMGPTLLRFLDGDTEDLDNKIANSTQVFGEVVSTLKEMNPNAALFFQKVYNPLFLDSAIIGEKSRQELISRRVDDKRLREISNQLLNRLNNIISDYLTAHPGAFYIVDAQAAYNEIYDADSAKGKALIYPDGVHPSNIGHAVISRIFQKQLQELGLAKEKSAVKQYRELRQDQLERLFSGSVNIKAGKKQLKKASSLEEIDNVYFGLIDGKSPVYC